MRRRSIIAIIALPAAVALLFTAAACAGNGAATRMSQPVASDARGRDLVGQPDAVPFMVTFRLIGTAGGSKGAAFVWRQGNDVRRWDWLLEGLDRPRTGDFTIERGFANNPTVFASDASKCTWGGPTELVVRIFCGRVASTDALSSGLTVLQILPVTQRLAQRQIAGQTADCYALGSAGQTATLCVWTQRKIPMLFQFSRDGHVVASIEAISVTDPPDTDLVPIEALPYDVALQNSPEWHVDWLKLPVTVKVSGR